MRDESLDQYTRAASKNEGLKYKALLKVALVCSNMNEAGDLEVKARPSGQSHEGCYWKIVGLRPTIFSGTPRN